MLWKVDRSTRHSAGFTVIELLIVIAIIGILASVLIPNLLNARSQAQVKSLQSHSKNVVTAVTAWLASDTSRSNADAVSTWSPCLLAVSNDGYTTAAAPGPASSCVVNVAANGTIDVTVSGNIGGAVVTSVNGSAP